MPPSLDLRSFTQRAPSQRHLIPTQFIEFPADSDFAKYLLNELTFSCEGSCSGLPSDPRVQEGQDFQWNSAKKDFEDETVMERQSGWDEKVKTAFDNNNSNNPKTENSGNDDEAAVAPGKVPAFSEFVDKIEEAMQKLNSLNMVGEGVCIVGAYCSIDDAGWALPSNTPSCTSLNDIFTTLTTSTKIVTDLKQQMMNNNNNNNSNNNNDKKNQISLYFGIRPWLEVNASTEFRVFIEHEKGHQQSQSSSSETMSVIGICQRHMDQLFPHLFPFAIDIAPNNNSQKEDNRDENTVDDYEEEGNEEEEQTEQSLKWSFQIEKILKDNILSPFLKSFEEEEATSSSLIVIDIIHPGPDQLHLPLHIVGVKMMPNETTTKKTGNKNGGDDEEDLPVALKSYPQDHGLFRIFGSYPYLKQWELAVKRYMERDRYLDVEETLRPSTVIKIATGSSDLFKDEWAAQRGGAPLEFVDSEMYQQALTMVREQKLLLEQEQQRRQRGRDGSQVIEEIVTTRSHVHGVENVATKKSNDNEMN